MSIFFRLFSLRLNLYIKESKDSQTILTKNTRGYDEYDLPGLSADTKELRKDEGT